MPTYHTIHMVIFKGHKFHCEFVECEILILEKMQWLKGYNVFNLMISENPSDLPSAKLIPSKITMYTVFASYQTPQTS